MQQVVSFLTRHATEVVTFRFDRPVGPAFASRVGGRAEGADGVGRSQAALTDHGGGAVVDHATDENRTAEGDCRPDDPIRRHDSGHRLIRQSYDSQQLRVPVECVRVGQL